MHALTTTCKPVREKKRKEKRSSLALEGGVEEWLLTVIDGRDGGEVGREGVEEGDGWRWRWSDWELVKEIE